MHISSRFVFHKKCLAAVLPVGLARRHRANPAASIRIQNCYAAPVLLSCLPSLVMNTKEVNWLILTWKWHIKTFWSWWTKLHIYKKLINSKVVDYWELKLRDNAENLSSLPYFKPAFMSLTKPHPMWTACKSNPFECHKTVITARMLSGRYLTDTEQIWKMSSSKLFWSLSWVLGASPSSLLIPYQHSLKVSLLTHQCSVAEEHIVLKTITFAVMQSHDQSEMIQLLLDCTTLQPVIESCSMIGTHIRDRLLYLCRTWCYSIHRERMSQL